MSILADFHCHLYPHYNFEAFLQAATENFRRIACKANIENYSRILALTERQDCFAFNQLLSGDLALPTGYQLNKTAENNSLEIIGPDNKGIFIIAGQQINTIEKLELLAFGVVEKIPSHMSWQDTFAAIRDANGIPVINWAPGKWWFGRGQLIKEIIQQEKDFLLCDTALRFKGYPRPTLLKLAASKGIKAYCGSDPLPIKAEEQRVASYCCSIAANLSQTHPALNLKKLLLDPNFECKFVGERLSFLGLAKRLYQYYSGGKA